MTKYNHLEVVDMMNHVTDLKAKIQNDEKLVAHLRAELLAEKSARMVERAALEFYATFTNWKQGECEFDVIDSTDVELVHKTDLMAGGARAKEALRQTHPDVGALINRLTDTLKNVETHAERRYPDHACSDCVDGGLDWRCWLHEVKRTLAATENDRKRMGL